MDVDDEGVEASDAADPISNRKPVYPFEIPVTALLKIAGVVLATVLLLAAMARAQQLVGLAIAAAVLASLVAPLVSVVARPIGRVASTVLVHVVLLVAIAAGIGMVFQSVQQESAALEDYTVAQIEDLAGDDGSTFLVETRLDERFGQALETWGVRAVVGDNATDGAGGLAMRASQVIVLVVFSIFFTLQADSLVSMAVGWTANRSRRRVLRDVIATSASSASTYTRRVLAVAVASGGAASTIAVLFDMPAVLLIGVAVALMSAIPVLGAFVGWAPMVVIAAVDRSAGELAVVVVVAALGAVATTWARSRFVTTDVDVGSFIVAIGIAAGLSWAALPGAICGMFLAVGVAAAATKQWTPDPDPISDSVAVQSERTRPEASYVRMTWTSGGSVDAIEDMGPGERLLLQPSTTTLVRVGVIVVLAFAFQMSLSRVGPIIVSALVGILIAIGLDRPVSWFQRWLRAPRFAVVIAGALLVVAAMAGLIAVTTGAFDGSSAVDTDVGGIVASLEEMPLVGAGLADLDIEQRIDQFSRQAPILISDSTLTDRALSVLGGGVVGAFWVLVSTVTCLLDGPRLVSVIDRRIPARLRRQAERLGRAAHRALSGYVAGSALVAALNGVIIGTIGFIVGVPAPAVLAIWAFSWNFVPQIGALVGWAPLLILTFLVGPLEGVSVLAVFVLYQLFENNLIQPTIVGHAVDISPLAALSAALLGVTVAGLVGAVLAIPVAGVARALVQEWRRDDFPRIRPHPAADASHPPSLP